MIVWKIIFLSRGVLSGSMLIFQGVVFFLLFPSIEHADPSFLMTTFQLDDDDSQIFTNGKWWQKSPNMQPSILNRLFRVPGMI